MKVSLISLGCPKNQVAAEQMLAALAAAGHEITPDPAEAEAVVVNTCAFIEDAKQEAIDTLLEAAQLKGGRLKTLLCAGCLAQLYGGEVMAELPEVDGVVGVGSCERIAEALEAAARGERPVYLDPNDAPVQESARLVCTGPAWAYLLIAEGCDNRCSYCLIPSIRGPFRSRPMAAIVEEAKSLAAQGYKELILVAQDLTHYGADFKDGTCLAALLRELCAVDGLEWLRLHYLYPRELDDGLIEVIASEPKIVKYLDIPIQHINDNILRKMNRRDRGAEIRALLKKLRSRIPGLVLRTSLITGLPGEGEAEFEELCEFLREAKIERAGVFPFSPEEGTPAAKMPHADADTARQRAELVNALQAEIMDEWERSLAGSVVEAICDEYDPEGNIARGRAYFDSPGIDGSVTFPGPCMPGDIVQLRVLSAEDGELSCEPI